MTLQITIQTVGAEMVVDMRIHDGDKNQGRHTAWRSETTTTINDVLLMLPEMALKLQAGEVGT